MDQIEQFALKVGGITFFVAGAGIIAYGSWKYSWFKTAQLSETARIFDNFTELIAWKDSLKDADEGRMYCRLQGIVATKGSPLIAPVSILHLLISS
jgi:hypothetical protein